MTALVFLALGLFWATIPEEPVLSTALVIALLWMEQKSFRKGELYCFSPSGPLILAASLSPNIGPTVAALALIFSTLVQKDGEFLPSLGQRLSLALGVFLAACSDSRFAEDENLLRLVSVTLAYLVFRIFLELYSARPKTSDERKLWRRLQLNLRPIELALAVSVLPLAFLMVQRSWLILLAIPLYSMTHLAAENAFLSSQSEEMASAFASLRQAEQRERKTSKELSKTKTEKAILENFARHLSAKPNPIEAAKALVATIKSLVETENVIVFLSDPPEAFYYEVQAEVRPLVQTHAHLKLSEPSVLDAMKTKQKVVLQASKGEEKHLIGDPYILALPLGEIGVVCIGSLGPFSNQILQKLDWLSNKAALALSLALDRHEENLFRAEAKEQVESLQSEVEHLSALVGSAESLVSSLDPSEVQKRFVELVRQHIPHNGGLYQEMNREAQLWGNRLKLPTEIAEEVIKQDKVLVIQDIGRLKMMSETPISSVLVTALNRDSELAAIVVLANADDVYSSELSDKFFVLCSQASLARSNAHLYQQVLRARQELEESQNRLVQSSKLTALGQLSAGVAHELNSPLGAIAICFDEAVELYESDPELTKRLLSKGQIAVEKAKLIVDRLLAYCRLESDAFSTVDLRFLLQDTVEFISYQLKTINVSVDTGDEEVAYLVEGDFHALQQVLTNLLVNSAQAVELAESRQAQIRLSLESLESRFVIEVEDNGLGIDPAVQNRIFEPFFTTKEIGDGTGLGLWASHQVVERHGGRLELTRSSDRGTVFSISLPAQLDLS